MKVIFLDRDGVINKYPGDDEYVKSWEEFKFLPRAKQALKKLADSGFKIFIVSNQSGVSKGAYSKKNLDLITKNMLRELNSGDIQITGVYYCTHRQEDHCFCRKPKSGLINMAVEDLKKECRRIELGKSYFIGDSMVDIQTGKAAGLKTILVFSGKEKIRNKRNWMPLPDYTAKDIRAAVDLVLKN